MKKIIIYIIVLIAIYFISIIYLLINMQLSPHSIERLLMSFISILFILYLIQKQKISSYIEKSVVSVFFVFFLFDIFYPTLESILQNKDLLFNNVSFLSNSEGMIILCGVGYFMYYFLNKKKRNP